MSASTMLLTPDCSDFTRLLTKVCWPSMLVCTAPYCAAAVFTVLAAVSIVFSAVSNGVVPAAMAARPPPLPPLSTRLYNAFMLTFVPVAEVVRSTAAPVLIVDEAAPAAV